MSCITRTAQQFDMSKLFLNRPMEKETSNTFDSYIKKLRLIPLVYLVLGSAWIAVTDWIVFHYKGNFPSLEKTSTFKGWFFVGITAFCLHLLIRRSTYRLRAANDQIARLSMYDQLTELPNRSVFIDRVERLIVSFKRKETLFGIIFADIDDFKLVNDTFGHVLGDALLKEFGARLTAAVRQTDTVSRFGGDEFMILLTDISGDHDIDHIFLKIKDALHAPFLKHFDKNPEVRASLGSALFPRDGNSLEELLQHADRNMYLSKQQP